MRTAISNSRVNQTRHRSRHEVRDMRHSRTSLAGLAAAALLFAACSSSGSSPAPVASVATSASAGAPSVVAAPPAPTNFTATRKNGSAPCPSSEESCSQTDFAWQASADAGTWFKIYSAGTGEGPDATCSTVQSEAVGKLNSKPGATSARAFDPMATGAGQICYWITAVNGKGESAQVPAAGNEVSTPSAADAAPPAPTNFTATRKSGSVPCPANGPDSPCSQVDFAWQASAGPETGFRIYVAATGEGPDATCLTAQASATVRVETTPDARTAQTIDTMAVGGGQICYWITAVNFSAESGQVAAAGN